MRRGASVGVSLFFSPRAPQRDLSADGTALSLAHRRCEQLTTLPASLVNQLTSIDTSSCNFTNPPQAVCNGNDLEKMRLWWAERAAASIKSTTLMSTALRPASAGDAAAPLANPMVKRIKVCEEMLGLSNDALSLPQRVAAAEELALGDGALPSRLAAIESAVGLA